MIKAAIFDMDGLLIDSEPYWKRIYQETYHKLGVDLTDKDRHQMMGRTPIENAKHLYEIYGWKKYSPEEVAQLVIDAMVKAIKTDIKLMSGADKALQIFKNAALPIAIASASPKIIVETAVDKLKIHEHFKSIYSAEHEPYGKPNPGVFIKTAELLEVSSSDCLVFEDAPNGVLAAKAATMKCIAVPEREIKFHPFIQTADIVLQSLEQFNEEILAKL